MQDAAENCPYSELVGEPLRLELNFIFPLDHVTELFALWERTSSGFRLQLTSSLSLEKVTETDYVSVHQVINRIPQLKYR